MSRFRPRASKDGNHDAIVKTFRDLFVSVVETHLPPEAGFPDLVLGYRQQTRLAETKCLDTRYGRRGLNPNQQQFSNTWRGSPIHVITTPDDALALVAEWSKTP
jgi:hypothetical protein